MNASYDVEKHSLSPRTAGLVQKFMLVFGLPIVAVLMVAGSETAVNDRPVGETQPLELRKAGYGSQTYDEASRRASRKVAFHKARAAQAEGEWLRHEGLARSLHRRSQLTGSFDDLANAVEQTQRSLALAPEGSGPLLTWASISMSSHDLMQSEAALAALGKVAVPPKPEMASEIAALTGDLAYYSGDPARAARSYQEAEKIAPSAGTAIRLARLAKSRGEFQTAQRWFANGAKRASTATPRLVANLSLQIGAVDLARGEYEAAREWFEQANLTFPGHWLIAAHLAQSKALEGDLEIAIVDMRELANRTQSPDIMDSLANMLRAAGRREESREWIVRSSVIWNERLERLPEAAIGHALEHELAFGTPARALQLAQQNLAIRPYAEAYLLMAQAYRKAGKFRRAQAQIEQAKAAGLRSAALYATESEVLTVLGQMERARAARDDAKALNPRIFEPETGFIWFSHG